MPAKKPPTVNESLSSVWMTSSAGLAKMLQTLMPCTVLQAIARPTEGAIVCATLRRNACSSTRKTTRVNVRPLN